MDRGWLKLHRCIQDVEWWGAERFTRGQAWVDMLMMAVHKDTFLMVKNENYPVPAGSFVTSQRKLSIRWKWGLARVNAFLNYLQKAERSVEHKTEHSFTHVFILNWEKYQGKNGTLIGTENGTVAEQSRKQIKKEKNDKKDSDTGKTKPFEKPTIEQIAQYAKEIGYHTLDAEKLFYYYDATGWIRKGGVRLSNWKSCVQTWWNREKKQQGVAAGVVKATPEQNQEALKRALALREQQQCQ